MDDNRALPNSAPDKQVKFHFDNQYVHDPKHYEPITLYQIGDLSCASGYEIGEHRQYCYEISYIVSGKGVFTTDDAVYPVREGDLIVHVPGQRHNGIADREDPFRFYYAGFEFRKEETDEKSDGEFLQISKLFEQVERPVVAGSQAAAPLFTGLFQEILNLSDFSPLMIGTYLKQLIVLAYRGFYEDLASHYAPAAKSDAVRELVYRVIHYIDLHLLELTELSSLADELSYSYAHISHIFSRETGLSIKQYYDQKRFEQATLWLRQNRYSITEIAANLHYQSIHSFSKAFRRHFGMSPTEYQAIASQLKK